MAHFAKVTRLDNAGRNRTDEVTVVW